MSVAATAGLIDVVGGRRWWRCPVCRQTLGEVTAQMLVVKAGNRMIRLPLIAGTVQECPRCGSESELLSS